MQRNLTLYGFIEDLEPMWISETGRHQSGLGAAHVAKASEDPLWWWIEIDCIQVEHFHRVVESPVPALKPTDDENAIQERRDLLDRVLGDQEYLTTLYLVLGSENPRAQELLERLELSTWHQFQVTRGERRIDMAEAEAIQPDPFQVRLLVASDPYTEEAWTSDDWEVEPLQTVVRQDLTELISLNHIPDIHFPLDDGGGNVLDLPPLLPQSGSPIECYRHYSNLEIDLGIDSSRAYHLQQYSLQASEISLIYDATNRTWLLRQKERIFSAETPTGRLVNIDFCWRCESSGEFYCLLLVSGDWVLIPDSVLQRWQNEYERQERRGKRVVKIYLSE